MVKSADRKAASILKSIPVLYFGSKVNIMDIAMMTRRAQTTSIQSNFFLKNRGSINAVNNALQEKHARVTEILDTLMAP